MIFIFFPRWYMWSFPRGYLCFWNKMELVQNFNMVPSKTGFRNFLTHFGTKHFWGNKKQKKRCCKKNETNQQPTPHQKNGNKMTVGTFLKLQHPHPPTSHRVRCNNGSQGTTKKGMPNEKPQLAKRETPSFGGLGKKYSKNLNKTGVLDPNNAPNFRKGKSLNITSCMAFFKFDPSQNWQFHDPCAKIPPKHKGQGLLVGFLFHGVEIFQCPFR